MPNITIKLTKNQPRFPIHKRKIYQVTYLDNDEIALWSGKTLLDQRWLLQMLQEGHATITTNNE